MKKNKNKNVNSIDKKLKNETIERQNMRKEHHIWVWLIFFAPVGIYLSIKYKAFKKWVIGLIIGLFIIIVALCVDVVINPYRVIEANLSKSFNTMNCGTFRSCAREGTINNEYIIYDVISTDGEFDVYLSDATGKKISAIKELGKDNNVYIANDFNDIYKKLRPETLRFLIDENNYSNYSDIKEIEEVNENDEKITKNDNTIYEFIFANYKVSQIFEIDGNNKKTIYTKNTEYELPKEVKKVLKDKTYKYGELSTVLSYKLDIDSRTYVVLMKNGNYYKIIFDDDGTITIYEADINAHKNTSYD